MHACILCILCILWTFCTSCILCTLCMHIMHACRHARIICMHIMHACYACIVCMHAGTHAYYACMHARIAVANFCPTSVVSPRVSLSLASVSPFLAPVVDPFLAGVDRERSLADGRRRSPERPSLSDGLRSDREKPPRAARARDEPPENGGPEQSEK